jgi:transposase
MRKRELELENQTLKRELGWAQLKIQSLLEELRKRRIEQLGPRSETLSDLQLELLLDQEPGTSRDEVEAEAKREPIPNMPPRERRQHPGRQRLPEKLERVEEVIPCPSQQCTHCGRETAVIGYDESEVLDVHPKRYFVRVTKREKRACRCCEQATVSMPELAPRIIEKGLASDAVVVDTVISKYCDHLPLYRQAAILEREAGLEIGRATLDGWVMSVGEMLDPVIGAMRGELLREPYLQADETTVLVQMRDKRGADHQAYLWQYGKPGGATVFDFCMGREREGPLKFLGSWEGILQTDGYQAYENIGGEKLVHVGCWAHARRKFVDAVKVNPKDGEAIKMVVRMDAMFTVDREARKQSMTVEERLALRKEHADSWVAEIRTECLALIKATLPKSALGQAVRYVLNQWAKLRRCFEYGEVELSNNLAENSMRGVALGRKNWLHIGSEKSGPKVAAIISVIESCRRLGVSAKQYLLDVLPDLNRRKLSEVASLTPARWAAARLSPGLV